MVNRVLMIRNFKNFYLLLVLLAFLTPQIQAQTAPDILVGQWDVTMYMGGMEIFATAEFTKNPDGSYQGVWTSNSSVGELTNIFLNQDLLTFDRSLISMGEQLDLGFEGKIKDNKLTGFFFADMGEIEVAATRKAPPANILGEWNFVLEFAGQRARQAPERPPAKITFTQKPDKTYQGKWTGGTFLQTTDPNGISLSNIKLEKDKLTFSRSFNTREGTISINFEGTVKGDKITGKFKIDTPAGEMREITANATRVKVNPLVGVWDILMTIDIEELPSILTFTEKEGILSGLWKGEMQGQSVEFLVSDVTLKDNNFTFWVVDPNQGFEISCKGTIKDDEISGYVLMDNGDIPFKGKRKKYVATLYISMIYKSCPRKGGLCYVEWNHKITRRSGEHPVRS
ncbi:MAG: hypothetical protein GY869_01600 [Planctomycetes bacterium]|nr:hypothetical protein [Planctomycetota bacterium]